MKRPVPSPSVIPPLSDKRLLSAGGPGSSGSFTQVMGPDVHEGKSTPIPSQALNVSNFEAGVSYSTRDTEETSRAITLKRCFFFVFVCCVKIFTFFVFGAGGCGFKTSEK